MPKFRVGDILQLPHGDSGNDYEVIAVKSDGRYDVRVKNGGYLYTDQAMEQFGYVVKENIKVNLWNKQIQEILDEV